MKPLDEVILQHQVKYHQYYISAADDQYSGSKTCELYSQKAEDTQKITLGGHRGRNQTGTNGSRNYICSLVISQRQYSQNVDLVKRAT